MQNGESKIFFTSPKVFFALSCFGFWTIFAAFAVVHSYAEFNFTGRQISWSFILVTRLGDWYFWALITPFIFWLGRRFPFKRQFFWRNLLLVQLPAGLLTAFTHNAAVAYLWLLWSPNSTYLQLLAKISYFFATSLLIYSGILAVFFVFDYSRKYRQRELQAANLKSELSQARLRALQMQLHPHFLFNTLNSISTLTFKQPQAANKMLVKLSELLRISLTNDEIQEVSLEKELDFLKTYLDIEQVRFQDRLSVDFKIENETLEARVPCLILQPLVENSIRHGISKRRGKGVIEICAKRENDKLFLQVCDNGLGLSENGKVVFKEGIGLTNTRNRLEGLYGKDFYFALSGEKGGGIEARIIIPFKTGEDVED